MVFAIGELADVSKVMAGQILFPHAGDLPLTPAPTS